MSNKNNNDLLDLLTEKQRNAKLKQQARSKENYQKNKEKIQERIKNHYLANKIECVNRVKKYNAEHKEEIREYAKKYYQKKKEKKALEKASKVEEVVQPEPPVEEKTETLHCEECNVDIKLSNRYAHFLSNKHLKNKKKNQDRVDD
jgi:hypothetical protein